MKRFTIKFTEYVYINGKRADLSQYSVESDNKELFDERVNEFEEIANNAENNHFELIVSFNDASLIFYDEDTQTKFVRNIMVIKNEIMDALDKVYEELVDGYNKNEIDDCHPSINLDEWDYQFYFDEEGNVYCLPNEGQSFKLNANISKDTKETVISIIKNFLED